MGKALPDTAPGWYEASLPEQERKRLGHFSTPPLLVEQILDACEYTIANDLSAIRVLDPACGSGNFLAAAAQRLLCSGQGANYAQDGLVSLIQHNIWGFDPDPVSCFLTEMRLRAVTAQYVAPPTSVRFHVHQSDALALSWEPCVDLFLANPPYLAAKNMDLTGYLPARRRGQIDSYLLFLSLGLHIVRPHGWLGLVLPDPLLARANAAPERLHLLKDCTIHHLWHLSGVFPAQVGAVVIIAQKCAPKSTHHISWVREKWNVGSRFIVKPDLSCPAPSNVGADLSCPPPIDRPSAHDGTRPVMNCNPLVLQSLFARQPRAEFRYLLHSVHGSMLDHLRMQLEEEMHAPSPRFLPLGAFLTIHRGEELGRKSPYLVRGFVPQVDEEADGRLYPVLLGGSDIRPYKAPSANYWIAQKHIKKPLDRYLSPKLLVVKSTDRLQAALDVQSHVALQTLYLLHFRKRDEEEDELYFFLALLNSRLLREYVYVLHTAYKWVQPQIEQDVLAHLPVPLASVEQKQAIIERSKQLARACSCSGANAVVEWNEHMQSMYEELERVICALYHSALLSS